MLTSDGLNYVKSNLVEFVVEKGLQAPFNSNEFTEKLVQLTEDAIILYGEEPNNEQDMPVMRG